MTTPAEANGGRGREVAGAGGISTVPTPADVRTYPRDPHHGRHVEALSRHLGLWRDPGDADLWESAEWQALLCLAGVPTGRWRRG